MESTKASAATVHFPAATRDAADKMFISQEHEKSGYGRDSPGASWHAGEAWGALNPCSCIFQMDSAVTTAICSCHFFSPKPMLRRGYPASSEEQPLPLLPAYACQEHGSGEGLAAAQRFMHMCRPVGVQHRRQATAGALREQHPEGRGALQGPGSQNKGGVPGARAVHPANRSRQAGSLHPALDAGGRLLHGGQGRQQQGAWDVLAAALASHC